MAEFIAGVKVEGADANVNIQGYPAGPAGKIDLRFRAEAKAG